jgi:ion channel
MDEPTRTPRKKEDKPLLPFVGILAINFIFAYVFLRYQPSPSEGIDIVPLVVGVLVLLMVFTLGLYALTTAGSTLYNLSGVALMFVTGFVMLQYSFATLYSIIGLQHPPDGITHDKWDALYFSVMTWTTVGYGDLIPVGANRWVACGEALLGTLYNGLALAVVIYKLNVLAQIRQYL